MSETLAQEKLDTPVVTPDAVASDKTPVATPAATPDAAPAATPAVAPDKTADKTPGWEPDKWREFLAEGDEKRLRQLQRLADPKALAKKAFSLEAMISSGEYKRALPKDAKPEEVAEWRKEQGLPDTPEGYQPELPDGLVLGETDKTTLQNFQKFAFENNLSNDALSKTLGWYFSEQDRVNQEREIADQDFHEESKDALMAEWGLRDYRTNTAAMGAIRDQMPEGLAARLLSGRTADGRLIGDDTQFLKWFATLSRELNPTASVVGLEGGKTVESELEAIRTLRRNDPNKYDQDKAMQARELELLTAQSKSRARQG